MPIIKLPKIKIPKITFPKELLFLEKWKFGKRYIAIVIPLVCLAVVGTVTIGAISPLILQIYRFGQDIKVLDLKIKDYKGRLELAKSLDKQTLEKQMTLLNRKFSPDYSLSYVLNSLTELSKSLGIRFISINPGSEMSLEEKEGFHNYSLKVLPIGINLESEYRNFGKLLDSLGYFPNCLVIIKGYSLCRDENILPRLSAKLDLEVCILEGKKAVVTQAQAKEEPSQ